MIGTERKEMKRLAGQLNGSLTRKYNNLKDDIISALDKLVEKGYGRFKKPINIPIRLSDGNRKFVSKV